MMAAAAANKVNAAHHDAYRDIVRLSIVCQETTPASVSISGSTDIFSGSGLGAGGGVRTGVCFFLRSIICMKNMTGGTFWLKSEPTLTNIRTKNEPPRRRSPPSPAPQKKILRYF